MLVLLEINLLMCIKVTTCSSVDPFRIGGEWVDDLPKCFCDL